MLKALRDCIRIHGIVTRAVDAAEKGNDCPMNTLITSAVHAAVGGFTAGFLAAFAGANWKVALLAGAGSAVTSVVSLFSQSPNAVSSKTPATPGVAQ